MLRSSFGIIGSNVPALIRALVACGWFGIQTLFGGIAVHLMLAALFDGWKQLGGVGEVIGFFLFWVANVWVVLRGSESIKWLEVVAAPLLMLVGVGLLVWAWPQASVAELLARPPNRPAGRFVLRILPRRAHRDGRFLGDAVAQHPRLQPLREIAAGADRRPDRGPAADDGAVRGPRRRHDRGLRADRRRDRLRSRSR